MLLNKSESIFLFQVTFFLCSNQFNFLSLCVWARVGVNSHRSWSIQEMIWILNIKMTRIPFQLIDNSNNCSIFLVPELTDFHFKLTTTLVWACLVILCVSHLLSLFISVFVFQMPGWILRTMRRSWLWRWPPMPSAPRSLRGNKEAVSHLGQNVEALRYFVFPEPDESPSPGTQKHFQWGISIAHVSWSMTMLNLYLWNGPLLSHSQSAWLTVHDHFPFRHVDFYALVLIFHHVYL